MNIKKLSNIYDVRKITASDISAVFQLCEANPQYYHHCPPMVTEESIKADMQALPKGKTAEDKYYLGLWNEDELVAVLDLILNYPDKETAFIGFFMLNTKYQGCGTGTRIIEELCDYLKSEFTGIRLGYVKGNPQSEHFWLKNQFRATGIVTRTEKYEIVIMRREL